MMSGLSEEAQSELRNIQMRSDLDEVELAAEPGMLIFQGTHGIFIRTGSVGLN